jgi:hypothetical protein
MNRRAFLAGLVASTAIAACPAAVEVALSSAPATDWKAYFEQWMKDASNELVKCWEDQILYGISACKHTSAYPYIQRIDPIMLEAPTRRGGLFND